MKRAATNPDFEDEIYMEYVELKKAVVQDIKTVIVPELRRRDFKGSFPHFRRIYDDGKVDYLSFQFNKYCGSFIVEIAVAYPYLGKSGNFYYWDKITPEFIKKSDYGYTNERLRIEPGNGEWFEFNEYNYHQTVELVLQMIINNMDYFDKKENVNLTSR
jgi:hypothetical protein